MGRSLLVAFVALLGCTKPQFATVPGQTNIAVSRVAIEGRQGEHLDVSYKPLLEYLALRKADAIRPGRDFNEYKVPEDRRRIAAYLQDRGYFDAQVDEPKLTFSPDGTSVSVTWAVHEGEPYRISSVNLLGAPKAHEQMLRAMIPFGVGDRVSLDTYRPLRRSLAERLQDEGFGHARGYSRAFVDREAKTVAWFYYLDAGPKTTIGSLTVEGNKQVPADVILARAGLSIDKLYSTTEKRRAEVALLDTGAFSSAVILSDADIQSGPPEHPDTGGIVSPDQIDAEGNLVPRKLSEQVAVRVIVVEAPGAQVRLELGVEADPARVDSYAGARVILRNLLAPAHHLVLEGNVGYGLLFTREELAHGVYGSALAQYIVPSVGHRDVDGRLTARWRDVLYPAAMLREVVAGPGAHATLARGVTVDVDAFARFGRQLDQPMFDAMTTSSLALPMAQDSRTAVGELTILADRRNDRVEPSAGWLLGARASYAPGLGDHRWLKLTGDARAYKPLTASLSVGVRASGGVVALQDGDGLPLGPRLFGGGAHGMRGFARDQLSPTACDAMGECQAVGGRSLVESSVELRLLPFRKLYGAALFVDAGAAGAGMNAFERGISVAGGLGARIRSWYLPIGFDVSYGFVRENKVASDLDRLLVFFRIGEAF